MSNADNAGNGAKFQKAVQEYFIRRYGPGFILETKLKIGDPEKDHKFDIVNSELGIVIECKRYTWTEAGNVPSAKIRTLNEAVLFLRLLEGDYEKYIVMLKAHHPKKKESLAAYYCRTYNHLLGDIHLAEYDPKNGEFRILNEKKRRNMDYISHQKEPVHSEAYDFIEEMYADFFIEGDEQLWR